MLQLGCLVGGLEHFLFSHILGIIPTDSYFSEGLKPPTSCVHHIHDPDVLHDTSLAGWIFLFSQTSPVSKFVDLPTHWLSTLYLYFIFGRFNTGWGPPSYKLVHKPI